MCRPFERADSAQVVGRALCVDPVDGKRIGGQRDDVAGHRIADLRTSAQAQYPGVATIDPAGKRRPGNAKRPAQRLRRGNAVPGQVAFEVVRGAHVNSLVKR